MSLFCSLSNSDEHSYTFQDPIPLPPAPQLFFFLLTSVFSKGKNNNKGLRLQTGRCVRPFSFPYPANHPYSVDSSHLSSVILHGWRWLCGAKNKNNWRAKMACCLRINGHLRLTTGWDFAAHIGHQPQCRPPKGPQGPQCVHREPCSTDILCCGLVWRCTSRLDTVNVNAMVYQRF